MLKKFAFRNIRLQRIGKMVPSAGGTNSLPVNSVAPQITGSLISGSTITTSFGTWTGYPAPTYTYQWKRNGTNISGQTADTYVLAGADVGTNITCLVTATNSSGPVSQISNTFGPIISTPANTVAPVVSGTISTGSTLTATTGTWTGSPTPTYAYQWKQNGTNISGATASTYTLVSADASTNISCLITATNSAAAVTQISNTVGPITSTPTNTASPVVSGTTVVGNTLATTTGTWTGYPVPTYAYQWKRDGANISGATASTYVLVSADAATNVTCTVTATNTNGSVSQTSNSIGPVTSIPANTSVPVVSGSLVTGSTLTATTGTWTGYPAPTFAYQWYADLSPISGQTSSTYTTLVGDIGKVITVTIRATNSAGYSTVASSNFGPITDVAYDAPLLSGLTIDISGDPDFLSLTTTLAGTLYWVVTSSATAPTYTQIVAGNDHTGAVAAATGNFVVTAPDVDISLDLYALSAGDFYIHCVEKNGTVYSNVISSPQFTIANTAPVISDLIINTSSTPNQMTLNVSEDGTLYWVVTTSATTPTATQIVAGQNHAGVAATLSNSFSIVEPGSTSTPTLTGLAAGDYYIHCVLNGAIGGLSNALTSSQFTIAAVFTPAWQQFDGLSWLERNSDMTGMPTNSAGFLAAMTYSPSATDIGQARELFVAVSSVNKLVSIIKSSLNGMDNRIETSSDVQQWIMSAGTGIFVAGGKYLILMSINPATVGAKTRVIDLATGSVVLSLNDTDTGTLGGPSISGWVIGAASGTGTRATSGQIERVMFWANTYADAGDTAVQALFHTAGALRDPADAVAAIGVTPHVNISGAALQTGTNLGSGGNFTKDGTGVIVPV